MNKPDYPIAILAAEAPLRAQQAYYPEPFRSRMAGREKRPLAEVFGVTNFGVNLTRLKPGALSSVRHAHTRQDEFVYIVSGHPTLVTNQGEFELLPGMCVGFKAGTGDAHHLLNRTAEDVVFLEVGDRSAGDGVVYPDDDLKAELDRDGRWRYTRKDGTPY